MDITLIKTFLEVAATGSFVAASERLYVTQSAVSLRVQRLEDGLGQQLFTRSKAGAELTPSGREFEHYALSMVKLWEEARQQIAIPDGFSRSLTIGAQYSLWPRLGFRWLDRIQAMVPDLSLRAELGMPDRLTRFLSEGVIQCALTYSPQLRPGFDVQQILQEELILVASWPEPTLDLDGRYVFIDWGPEFVRAHALSLPELKNSGLTMSLGALGADYVINRRAAAYLPARYVQRHLDAGELHLVPDAPRFPYPIWVVWREDVDPIVRAAASASLAAITGELGKIQSNILSDLANLSGDAETLVLGEAENGH
ncbi:LysR family transcriptional regulator [Thalassovita taeanensis]|uniref:DNA-binding transcriptional regulator, LysR family n=1 Tax=Thalassovita taeanensis TaxID=657014 RepID=A0A1H9HHJ4_9RHOB|nr:LysR family transcriptional regulator [Thalassovita taeanensis]SEQ61774.1 DNA-binding transcriptional regulator, LysR family [Thalassovita taeanensis]